jgi:hypothetical protein
MIFKFVLANKFYICTQLLKTAIIFLQISMFEDATAGGSGVGGGGVHSM